MPGLNPSDLHIDGFLTNILIGYRTQGLIADQIFPVVNVRKQTDVYAQIDRGNWFRIPDTKRAPGSKPSEVSYTVSSGTYVARNYALATRVPWETLDNADEPHDPLARQGELLIDLLNLDFEARVYNTVVSGVGSSTTNTVGSTNAWDDFANSDPIGQCEVGQEAIRRTTGRMANLCVIGYRAWLKMRRHPDLIARASALGAAGVGGVITPEEFGRLIMVDRVIVAQPIKNTAEEGQADAFTDVWSTHLIMACVADRPGIMVPTFGYSFRWTGPNIGGAGPGNFTILRKSDDVARVEYLQTMYYQDEKIVSPELGFLIQTGVV